MGFLLLLSATVVSALATGDRVRATSATNIRSCAGTINCTVLAEASAGSLGVILSGPTTADGYTWWRVDWDTLPTGWSIQTNLAAVAVPSVSSISPTTMSADGVQHTLTINGSNFQSGNVVQFKWGAGAGSGVWNSSNSTPSIASSTRMTIPMNPGTVNDTIYVRVCRSSSATTSADCSSGAQSVVVTVTVPVPSVSSVSPTSMAADGVQHTLTINGSNFQSGNVVQFKWGVGAGSGVWTQSNSAPSVASSTRMTIPMNPGTVNDTIYVRACRSTSATASSDCSSGTHSVVVTAAVPVPSVSSVSPTSMNADGMSHTLTISGSDFQSGNVVQFKWGVGAGSGVWNTSNSAPTVGSSTQMTVLMNPGTVTDTIFVRVCRSAAATTTTDCSSGTHAVTVTAAIPIPAVSSLSPTTMSADGLSHMLTISGNNFQSGNVVQFKWGVGAGAGVWNTSNSAPTVGSSTQMTVLMNPGTVTDTIFVRVCRSATATTATDCSSGTHAISVTVSGPPGSFAVTGNGYCRSTAPSGPAIALTWTIASGATTYEVRRDGILQATLGATTAYDDHANLVGGRAYTYGVRARNSSGSVDSPAISVVAPSNCRGLEPAPTLLSPGSASSPGSSAELTTVMRWSSSVPPAGGYRLSVGELIGGSYGEIFDSFSYFGQPVFGSSLALPAGTLRANGQYRWKMAAFDASGIAGPDSQWFYFWTAVPATPSLPPVATSFRMPIGGEAGADLGGLSISTFPDGYPRIRFDDPTWCVTTANNRDRNLIDCRFEGTEPYSEDGDFHAGEDWNRTDGADLGEPVTAIADGQVGFVGCLPNFGFAVGVVHRLRDGELVASFYAHLKDDPRLPVSVGGLGLALHAPVRLGDRVGLIGNTHGSSCLPSAVFSPHLHFEIRRSNYVDRATLELTDPNHWPGANTADIRDNYLDPSPFLAGIFGDGLELGDTSLWRTGDEAPSGSVSLSAAEQEFLSIADGSQTGLDVTGDQTLELWLRPASQPGNFQLVGKYSESTNQRSYGLQYAFDDGMLLVSFAASSDCRTETVSKWPLSLTSGSWHHLALVYRATAGAAELFVDGSSQGTRTEPPTALCAGSADFTIGQRESDRYYDGLIDEVRVWSAVRTAEEISANRMVEVDCTSPGLVAYWKLNGDGNDCTPNRNDLVLGNGVSFTSEVPFR